MSHKTKIIATIGPASSGVKTLSRMAAAGMNVARLNFSHGDHASHGKIIKNIRLIEKKLKKPIAILADMGGPKIRTGKFVDGRSLKLKPGDMITFAPEGLAANGEIPVTFRGLHKDVRPKDILLLDDGSIKVKVVNVRGERISARVISGGYLKEHKGINLPGIELGATAITKKDVPDMKFALSMGADLIGLSFVQRKADIEKARKLMRKFGHSVPIIAKIERQTALNNIQDIVSAADAIMIARGDLGVETPLEEVPVVQKRIIKIAHKMKKPAIVATQMLESMVQMDRPTRAEVSDVANSVFDGADVVMLSAETSVGHDPVNAIRTMSRILGSSEKSRYFPKATYEPDAGDDSVTMATARSACFASEEAKARAICVFTSTGRSALYVSKQRPDVKIIAMTASERTCRRMEICFGVTPFKLSGWSSVGEMTAKGVDALKRKGIVKKSDKIVVVCGTTTTPGATNMIRILSA